MTRAPTPSVDPVFFATPLELRAWLQAHHRQAGELWVGFHKRGSGRPSLTWPESVDQALCFGWIDGVRRRIDDASYTIRFTPRKAGSTWSAVNVKRAEELVALGLMRAAGRKAFEARSDDRTGIYSYEQGQDAGLTREYERRFRANTKAWRFFQSRPPWYRRTAVHWVMRAQRKETRERRLAALIEDSEREQTIGPLTRPGSTG